MSKARSKACKKHAAPGIHKIGEYSKNLGNKLMDVVFAVEGDKKKYISIISDTEDLSPALVEWVWLKREVQFQQLHSVKNKFMEIVSELEGDHIQSIFQQPFYICGHICFAYCYLIGRRCVIDIGTSISEKDSYFKSVGIRVIHVSAKDAVNTKTVSALLKQISTGKYWQKQSVTLIQ